MKLTLTLSEKDLGREQVFTGEGPSILAALAALDADLTTKYSASILDDEMLDLNELLEDLKSEGTHNRCVMGDGDNVAVFKLEGFVKTPANSAPLPTVTEQAKPKGR